MAQSDQVVQNATFPAVRADINDNLAALYSQSSGASAPTVTVAFQPWVDTSVSPPLWKIRNAANTGWITIGTLDVNFAAGGVTPIANGGTGQTTASAAINALLPSQTGNSGKYLTTDGSVASWLAAASGVSAQVFTSSGTYTPTANKVSFLVFATGGGGGGGNTSGGVYGGGGGGGGSAFRIFDTTEMGASAVVTIGSGGGSSANGGNTSFAPAGTGSTITGSGGSRGIGSAAGAGGTTTNSLFNTSGQYGSSGGDTVGIGGSTLWAGGLGRGGNGTAANGAAGTAGVVFVLEW